MIPTQEFENFPEFANAGEKTQPNDQKYAQGFLPSDTLPAEWQNWFLAGATRGITALDTGLSSVEAEINTVLQSRQEQPSATATNQLLTVLEKIKAEAILAAHPVGSLYWTSKNENPAITFGGGTWKQIKDKFILAAGDTYTAEATGGSATKTLDLKQIPSHTHGLNSHTHTLTPAGTVSSHSHGMNNHTHTFTPEGIIVGHNHTLNNHTHTFKPAGTVSSHTHSMQEHTHAFTPEGTVSSHSHGLNSHTHSVGAHSHGLNSHTHSFTPAGIISGGAHSHTINNGNTSSSGTTTTAGFRGTSATTGNQSGNPSYSWTGGHSHRALVFTGNERQTVNYKYAPNTDSSYASNNWGLMGSGAPNFANITNHATLSSYADSVGYATVGNYGAKKSSSTANQKNIIESTSLTVSGTCTGNHTHSVTATGYLYGSTDSATPSMTFSGTAGTTGAASGNTANSTAFNTGAATGDTEATQPAFTGTQGRTSAPSKSLTTATEPTFTGTLGTTGGSDAYTSITETPFNGTQGTTSAASGNTAETTPTFTGIQGTTSAATGNTAYSGGLAGVTQAVNIMPPYEVKYCWERTA